MMPAQRNPSPSIRNGTGGRSSKRTEREERERFMNMGGLEEENEVQEENEQIQRTKGRACYCTTW
jgi:hypothetical protein